MKLPHFIQEICVNHTLVVRSVVNIDVTNADDTTKVHSQFSCIMTVIIKRALASSSTITV